MTTFKSSTRVIRAPGTLISSPTDLSDAAGTGEYGGAIIGSTRGFTLSPLSAPFHVECEGLGDISDILEPSNRYTVKFFLRGWDKDAVASTMSRGYTAGSVTGNAVWKEVGATAGQSATARALIWLYVPDDTHNHPALIIRYGVPDLDEGSEIAFQRREEFGLNVIIDCMRNASGQVLDLGHLADLTL